MTHNDSSLWPAEYDGGPADEQYVTLTVSCDGLVEFTALIPAYEHDIAAELMRAIPWFTNHSADYAAALIDQLMEDGDAGKFTVNTASHGPITFEIV